MMERSAAMSSLSSSEDRWQVYKNDKLVENIPNSFYCYSLSSYGNLKGLN